MEKLKWNYDKEFKQWWIPNAGGGFKIRKDEDLEMWELRKHDRLISIFYKLTSAKQVAQLIHNG